MSVSSPVPAALGGLAGLLHPVCGASATAAAIVLLTVCVRLALHPLARAAVRGEKARAALAPRVAELRRRHGRDSARLARAMSELYEKEQASPFGGLLPMLVQIPVFMLMYHAFSRSGGGPHAHALLGAPLGENWPAALAHGGLFGARGAVYLGLFAVIAAVAAWNVRRARRTAAAGAEAAGAAAGAKNGADPTSGLPGAGAIAKYGPLLSFTTLVTAAVLPLAAGLYLATTTAWSAAERAWLYRTPGAGPRRLRTWGTGRGRGSSGGAASTG
ncbi:YidC/Oxa1 family membrane protein insertase [Actinacidiphila acidipaludis]|uniref:YidC/Oxa1 family membrane protein insertase n=1 Tax=Actinacidiphila acidipaludis TaxID=2873382 RepID=UPI00223B8A17|nr:YidC/Oxa1 family membrane protein insertase [Streptomyces acidipaludis]